MSRTCELIKSVSNPIRFVHWAAPDSAAASAVERRNWPTPTDRAPVVRTPRDADLRYLARDILRALGKAQVVPTDTNESQRAKQRAQTPAPTSVSTEEATSSVARPSQRKPRLLPAGNPPTVRGRESQSFVDRPARPRDFYVLVPPPPPYVKAAALRRTRTLEFDPSPSLKGGLPDFKEPSRQYQCK
ncbi:hypothetical protein B0H14DRAFT_3133800, partial [Mycena olivaceomarginata]